eukprot:TRINITY_DN39354_c0_g1_i1.p1 TRINITY_DN39354_c0_g1~~TRINITY_DN39354_c0_g1_i1.p1  ORF type:complete len:105 (+),score=9.85 TRINITY_DN39354_c0_g1_i1:111-425(+)
MLFSLLSSDSSSLSLLSVEVSSETVEDKSEVSCRKSLSSGGVGVSARLRTRCVDRWSVDFGRGAVTGFVGFLMRVTAEDLVNLGLLEVLALELGLGLSGILVSC